MKTERQNNVLTSSSYIATAAVGIRGLKLKARKEVAAQKTSLTSTKLKI